MWSSALKDEADARWLINRIEPRSLRSIRTLEHPFHHLASGHRSLMLAASISYRIATMTTDLPTLDVRTSEAWRQWLEKNHSSSSGIWLIRHKAHAAVDMMRYEDLVSEALCFGWIDSLIKRVDELRYAIKVTPRRSTSKWSALNRDRWNRLKEEGRLAAAGLAAAPTTNTYGAKPTIPELPAYIARAFKANAKAWAFFQTLSARNRRNFIVWIHTAKRPETREKRIRESIALLAAGRELGLK